MAAVVALAIEWTWLGPLFALTFRTSDDAFYYFQVARHWTAGHGPTFDGLHPTNGFHPLWMLLALPVYAAFGAYPEVALRAVLTLVWLIAGAAAWWGYRACAWHAGRAPAAAAVLLLLSPPFLNPLANGLETGLLILLLFLFLEIGARRDLFRPDAGAIADATLGMLLGLLFLARLDSVFVILAAFAAIIVRARASRAPLSALAVKLLRTGTVAALYALPYLAWNRATFGHAMPISGALKNAFPTWSFSLEHLTQYHGVYGLGQLALAGVALLTYGALRRRGGDEEGQRTGPPRASTPLWVLAAGCALHFANTMIYMVWGVHWWHFAGYVPLTLVCTALLLSTVASRLRHPRAVLGGAAAAIALFVVFGHLADTRRRGGHHDHWLAAALWARENLPGNAVVAMTDCGLFGYFSERPTVNLDGVINGYAYQDALRDHRLAEFLDRAGVTHVATHAARYRDGEFLIWLPSRLHRAEGGAIVGRESAEVYRSTPYDGVVFAIWDRRGVQVVDDVAALTRAASLVTGSGR